MKKILFILGAVFLVGITILMPVISYTSWKDQQDFSRGDKGRTEAVIKVDEHKVKTYNYKENHYGVDASKSSWKDGDKVTVYFLENRPEIVSENPYVYNSKIEIIAPLIWLVLFVGIILLNIFVFLRNNLKSSNKI